MTDLSGLSRRLEFLGLDAAASEALRSLAPVIGQALPPALDAFYEQVRAFPETARFFPDEARVTSARERQLSHWRLIAEGEFDSNYEGAVRAVGNAHARIGLEPRWYIGGYAHLLERLVRAAVRQAWPKGPFTARQGADDLSDRLGALIKAAMLDMDLAISMYLEAAEEARRQAEREVLARERQSVVATVGAGMARLAEGDLTARLPETLPEEYARLRDDFNAAVSRLHGAMGEVADTAGGIRTGAEEIAIASDDLARRTEQQAASLEETAAALERITATVDRTAVGARQANQVVASARDQAERSGDVVTSAVAAMGQIETSSSQISRIIGVIDEIAFQTNLLALNAGVEAARAGEAGRGFAVVASEVRGLAQRSADAAKEIKGLITASAGHVEDGVRLVAGAGEALHEIVAKVAEIDELVAEIASSAQEQAAGLNEVNVAVSHMDQVVQQNAAMVEQATAATHSLKAETAQLAALVGRFNLQAQQGGAASAPVSGRESSERRLTPGLAA